MIPIIPPAIHAPTQAIDRAHFLAVIAEVESGNNPHAIGPKGERSAYQITRRTWKSYAPRHPIQIYGSDSKVSLRVATEHFDWLAASLRTMGYPLTVENLACCWRLGLTRGSQRIRSGAAFPDTARRVANLYADSPIIPGPHPHGLQ